MAVDTEIWAEVVAAATATWEWVEIRWVETPTTQHFKKNNSHLYRLYLGVKNI